MKRKKKISREQIPGATPEIMDIKALARYLAIGRSKIYGLIRQKKIPAARIGRQYRFSKPIVDAWLRERLIMQPADPDLPLFSRGAK
ncbi:MAG: helix-turn-helix domain-containing protein [Elusimicrobiota bacterium]